MKFADIVAAAAKEKDFSRLVDAVPYAKFLGITVDDRYGELIATLAYNPRNIGNPILPAIHGGVIGALLETTAIFHLLWQRESIQVPKIITITVDYLRSAGPVDTHAKGFITKLGSRVANVRIEAWQTSPDKPVAMANANFLVTPAE